MTPQPAPRPCPACGRPALRAEVRGHDTRSVEACVWVVCEACGHATGPFKV